MCFDINTNIPCYINTYQSDSLLSIQQRCSLIPSYGIDLLQVKTLITCVICSKTELPWLQPWCDSVCYISKDKDYLYVTVPHFLVV